MHCTKYIRFVITVLIIAFQMCTRYVKNSETPSFVVAYKCIIYINTIRVIYTSICIYKHLLLFNDEIKMSVWQYTTNEFKRTYNIFEFKTRVEKCYTITSGYARTLYKESNSEQEFMYMPEDIIYNITYYIIIHTHIYIYIHMKF